MWLDQLKIHALHAAVISSGLDRAALLSGVHPAFTASLPIASTPAQQILSDLNQLNGVDALSDGSIPLLAWLRNATMLAVPRKESRVFEEAAGVVARAPRAQGAARSPPPVSSQPTGASAQRDGAVQVFVSAAPCDVRFVDALARHLAVLARQGAIELWHRGKIPVGADVPAWMQQRVDAADLVVLMVSPDFMANDDTYAELERALFLRDQRSLRVVPVIVRPVDLGSTPLAGLMRLPRSGVPISASSNADATYVEIVTALRAIVTGLRKP